MPSAKTLNTQHKRVIMFLCPTNNPTCIASILAPGSIGATATAGTPITFGTCAINLTSGSVINTGTTSGNASAPYSYILTITGTGNLGNAVFTNSGTYNILAIGGGGSGANGFVDMGSSQYCAGGGGGGAQVVQTTINSSPSVSYSIVIGAGGSNDAGGSTTTFGTTITSIGGRGGYSGNAGSSGGPTYQAGGKGFIDNPYSYSGPTSQNPTNGTAGINTVIGIQAGGGSGGGPSVSSGGGTYGVGGRGGAVNGNVAGTGASGTAGVIVIYW